MPFTQFKWVFQNISLMNINVNNDFRSCAAGTMGGKTEDFDVISIINAQFLDTEAQIR